MALVRPHGGAVLGDVRDEARNQCRDPRLPRRANGTRQGVAVDVGRGLVVDLVEEVADRAGQA